MSNGLLNASGLTTPQVTTDKILLEGEDLKDLLAFASTSEIRITAPHSLGDFYFSITPYMPEGVLPLNGSEVSRTTYSDLYDYVLTIHNELVESGKKFIVSEEEWQNISIENNGYVPYYSYGVTDGMFRLPRMSGYLKATGEVDEAGNYVAEGLPNITGELRGMFNYPTNFTSDGVFEQSVSGAKTKDATGGGGYWSEKGNIIFSANDSNPIYGNSEHVTPETNTLFVGVWALTAFTQVGTANLNEIKEILSQCETILGDSLPLLSSRYDNRGLETSAWKIGDGTWLDGRIYTDAYDKLIEKIAEGNSQYLEMKEGELLSPIEFPENFLIDTESVKFRLPISAGRQSIKVEYDAESGNSYEIFSDGWCIQRLYFVPASGASASTLNFLLPFRDIKYSVRSTDSSSAPETVGTDTGGYEQINVIDGGMTTTSFRVSHQPDRRTTFLIEGYITEDLLNSFLDTKQVYFKVSHGVDEGRINIEEKLTEFEETAYTRLDEVIEEVSKDYVVHVDKQVGELYFSFDNYCPDGVIPLDGRLVSRATYADLWEWVQEKGLVKDDALITTNDENTVSIFNEDGSIRYCQWYGSGDGELTFRMPKINGYLGATGDNTLAGNYVAEGLPNITGTFSKRRDNSAGFIADISGSFTYVNGTQNDAYFYGNNNTSYGHIVSLDASLSSPIYGNSEHVTPETNTLFVGVWAITATKAAVFDFGETAELLKQSESYLMNNVPLMSSRWDRDGLGNLGWVKADGSWIDGKTYTGAYAYCVEKLVSGHEDFIGGQVATISEENFDKFIVDRIGKRFRLPISNGQREYTDVQGLNNPDWVLYWKLAHEFYVPAQAEIQEKLDLIDNLVAKTDINLPTLSSRWDSDFAENIGWVKSEGHWLNGNIYRDAYDLMVSRIGIHDKFVAATVGTELTDENADKFLIDTTAVKFRLPLINGERTLVTTYKEGKNWYNLYSDGWLEQGGYLSCPSEPTTLTLYKPYKAVDYTVTTTGSRTNNNTGNIVITSRTVTSISFYIGDDSTFNAGDLHWRSVGFSEIPVLDEYNKGNYLFFKLADEVPSTIVDTEQVVADLKQECSNNISEMRQECVEYKADMDAILNQGNDYICNCIMPDYSSGVSMTNGTVVPVNAIGVAGYDGTIANTTMSIKVNGVVVASVTHVGADSRVGTRHSFLIPKNATINLSNVNYAYYYPMGI